MPKDIVFDEELVHERMFLEYFGRLIQSEGYFFGSFNISDTARSVMGLIKAGIINYFLKNFPLKVDSIVPLTLFFHV